MQTYKSPTITQGIWGAATYMCSQGRVSSRKFSLGGKLWASTPTLANTFHIYKLLEVVHTTAVFLILHCVYHIHYHREKNFFPIDETLLKE